MDNKKIEVYFNKQGYNNSLRNYNDKLKTRDQITDEVKRLIAEVDVKQPFFTKPLASFYLACQEHLNNPMNLSGEKLVGLYDMNITELKRLCFYWEEIKDLVKPKRVDYCVYAKTKAQIDKYNTANKLIKALDEANQYLYNRTPIQLVQPFRNMVKLDMNSNLVVNPAFIAS